MKPVDAMFRDGEYYDAIHPDEQAKTVGEYDIPLYTHPAKEQYKFGVDWSKDGNAVTVLKICEDGVAEVVFMDYQEVTHPAKTLTDEEIYACFHQYFVLGEPKPTHYELEYEDLIEFARAILRKAQEKC